MKNNLWSLYAYLLAYYNSYGRGKFVGACWLPKPVFMELVAKLQEAPGVKGEEVPACGGDFLRPGEEIRYPQCNLGRKRAGYPGAGGREFYLHVDHKESIVKLAKLCGLTIYANGKEVSK